MNIEQLNRKFAIPNKINFLEGKGNFIYTNIKNEYAEALVSTYAAQVLSFKPIGEAELFFTSDSAYFEAGKAAKAGIPVCWPWFGKDPEDKGRGSHGFVRNRQWDIVATETLSDGRTSIELATQSTEETLAIWPHEFELRIQIIVGKTLEVNLITTNKSERSFKITQGLHAYFNIQDIHQTRVIGFDDVSYLDAADGFSQKHQQGDILVTEEVDRIYTDIASDITIEDGAHNRQILVQSTGSYSTIVWNPWIDIAKSMGDLSDDDYLKFICVETTNSGPDVVEVEPGQTYSVGAVYSIS